VLLPAPGQLADDVINGLHEHANRLSAANQSSDPLGDISVGTRWRQYHIAVQEALAALRTYLGPRAAGELLLTPQHRDLAVSTPGTYGAWASPPMPEVQALGVAIATQVTDRVAALRTTADDLRALNQRLRGPGTDNHLVIADTNVYLHWHTATDPRGDAKLTSIPWRTLIEQRQDTDEPRSHVTY